MNWHFVHVNRPYNIYWQTFILFTASHTFCTYQHQPVLVNLSACTYPTPTRVYNPCLSVLWRKQITWLPRTQAPMVGGGLGCYWVNLIASCAQLFRASLAATVRLLKRSSNFKPRHFSHAPNPIRVWSTAEEWCFNKLSAANCIRCGQIIWSSKSCRYVPNVKPVFH